MLQENDIPVVTRILFKNEARKALYEGLAIAAEAVCRLDLSRWSINFLDKTLHYVQNIVKELPDNPLSLKDAEKEFEERYFKQALLDHNNNISLTARNIGLRFETLHRKLHDTRNNKTTSERL